MEKEYLNKCVVDLTELKINIYSNLGNSKHIKYADEVEFVNALRIMYSIQEEGDVKFIV